METEEIITPKSRKKVTPEIVVTKNSSRRYVTLVIGILFGALCMLAAGYYYYTTTEAYETAKQAKALDAVLDQAGALILLPPGEPSVFDIVDPDMLVGQQQFFAGSIAGDKLLVYPEQGKAIIYSPERNIIVNSGPVTFDDVAGTTAVIEPAVVAVPEIPTVEDEVGSVQPDEVEGQVVE